MNAIDRLHLDYPFMGSRQLCRALGKQGHDVGRLDVRSLMRKMGISASTPQRGTCKRNPKHKVFPYRLRKLIINRGNQVWALDTTYIRMVHGFGYLTAVDDVCSRRILAHWTAITIETVHAVEALEEAYVRFGKPDIVNTDQGSQFAAQEFVDTVVDNGVKLSMDGRGAWRDNDFVKRVWRSVENERVYLKAYESVSVARKDIAQYIDWYDGERSHSSLDGKTPKQVCRLSLLSLKEAA
jgi:putative transposase